MDALNSSLVDVDPEIVRIIRKTGLRESAIITAKADNGSEWSRINNIVAAHDRMVSMVQKHTQQKAVKDPVHGAIILAPWELDVISTWAMQRLRYIKQLGPTHLVYPGATHTRFEHSLGTNFIAKKCLDVVNYCNDLSSGEFYPLSNLLSDYHQRVFRAVALLHDVGHPPTSHTIEPAIKSWSNLEHTDLGEFLILNTEISEVLSDNGIKPLDVADVIHGRARDKHLRLLTDFVDSPLDIDKTDYLIRDAHFSGAELGLFPAERVLLTSRVVPVEGEYKRAFMLKALHSLEALILSRNWMFSDLYLHHAVRVAEAIINKATYERLREAKLSRNEVVGFFTRMIDADLFTWLRESEISFVREYADRIRFRRLFKVVLHRPLEAFPSDIQAKLRALAHDMAALSEVELELHETPGRVILDVVLPKLSADKMKQIPIIRPVNSSYEIVTMDEVKEAQPLIQVLRQQNITIPSVRVYSEPKFREPISKSFNRLFPQDASAS